MWSDIMTALAMAIPANATPVRTIILGTETSPLAGESFGDDFGEFVVFLRRVPIDSSEFWREMEEERVFADGPPRTVDNTIVPVPM